MACQRVLICLMAAHAGAFYLRYERIILSLCLLAVFVGAHSFLNELADQRPERYLPRLFEEHVPLVPEFIYVYLLGFGTVFIPAAVIRDRRSFRLTALRFLALMLVSFMFFLLFPFAVHRPELPPGGGVSAALLEWFQSGTRPYNSFPSLHVAFGILAAVSCLPHNRRVGWAMAVFAVLVALSTLFLKLHNALDVVAAVVIVLAVCLCVPGGEMLERVARREGLPPHGPGPRRGPGVRWEYLRDRTRCKISALPVDDDGPD